jgi:hypothetical protein
VCGCLSSSGVWRDDVALDVDTNWPAALRKYRSLIVASVNGSSRPEAGLKNAFSNILIDSNLTLRQTDPALSFPTYLQGIDAFDEDWTNMTITNNVVVTSACWGITFGSIHNSLVANNTVVDDGFGLVPGCIAAVAVVGKTSEGPLSTNTVVRNNLASQIDVDNRDSVVEADHNVGMCCKGQELSWYVNGVLHFLTSDNGQSPARQIRASSSPRLRAPERKRARPCRWRNRSCCHRWRQSARTAGS